MQCTDIISLYFQILLRILDNAILTTVGDYLHKTRVLQILPPLDKSRPRDWKRRSGLGKEIKVFLPYLGFLLLLSFCHLIKQIWELCSELVFPFPSGFVFRMVIPLYLAHANTAVPGDSVGGFQDLGWVLGIR